MDKNTVIAIVLSVLVIIGWQFFFTPKSVPKPPAPVASDAVNAPAPAATQQAVSAPTIPPAPQAASAKLVTVETDLYTAVFSTEGGTLRSFALKEYKDESGKGISLLHYPVKTPALGIGWDEKFALSAQTFTASAESLTLGAGKSVGVLTFTHSGEGYSISRTYEFRSGSYEIGITDKTEGVPAYIIALGSGLGISTPPDKPEDYVHTGPVYLKGTNREELKAKDIDAPSSLKGELKWIAQEDKYFASALVPKTKPDEIFLWNPGGEAAVGFKSAAGEQKFTLFIGPKRHELLEPIGNGLQYLIDYGFFSIIARPIMWLLLALHGFIGNYGWSIVFLTIIIRIPFIPIVHKGQKQIKRMQEVQPKIKAIQERYKKDQEKLNRELMELYKKHKLNPMSGCLPMLLQIPVFFALYKVLLISIELRGAPFMLWITDLSLKDPYYVLPIVMGISMVIQQRLTPSTADPMQQKLMMFLPVIFTFIFINFASGLVVYWLVNNLLSIGQQVYINKFTKTEETPA